MGRHGYILVIMMIFVGIKNVQVPYLKQEFQYQLMKSMVPEQVLKPGQRICELFIL